MATKQRGEELQGIIAKIREGTFAYAGREPEKTRWTSYDQAQIREMVDYLENVRDLVDEADRRVKARSSSKERGPGRPPVEAADIAKVLLMQTYTNSPNRVAEGLLLMFREKLGIGKHFSYKTIERGYDRDGVNEILDEVTKIVNETVEGKENRFAFDGTGFSSSAKENYAEKRQRQSARRKGSGASEDAPVDLFPPSDLGGWRRFTYVLTGVGVRHKLISGMVINPDQSMGETTMFPAVFQQTLSVHPGMEAALGDGAFAARWLTDLVSRERVVPYFLPRRNATFKSMGYTGWAPMLHALWKDPQEWMETYHMRSIAETVNSMIKARFGAPLRKKLDARRGTETRLKLVGHDVRRVGFLEVYEGIVPHWPRSRAI